MLLHTCKHPTATVGGFLLGATSSGDVVDAVPVFHGVPSPAFLDYARTVVRGNVGVPMHAAWFMYVYVCVCVCLLSSLCRQSCRPSTEGVWLLSRLLGCPGWAFAFDTCTSPPVTITANNNNNNNKNNNNNHVLHPTCTAPWPAHVNR
jgi:hypothetical protein